MAKTVVQLLTDVWNYGCKGDVITVENSAKAELDKLEKDGAAVYQEFKDGAKRAENAVEADVVNPVENALNTAKAKDNASATKK